MANSVASAQICPTVLPIFRKVLDKRTPVTCHCGAVYNKTFETLTVTYSLYIVVDTYIWCNFQLLYIYIYIYI